MIPQIRIEEFNYTLPDDRIAKYPLPQRDSSKLLIYRNNNIKESSFSCLPEQIPENSLMVFNDTKVVPARLHFQRASGAHIEIFCLEPVLPEEYVRSFAAIDRCRWKCIVGNVKRWKNDTLSLYNPLNDNDIISMNLKADLVERVGETSIVEFSWDNQAPFSKVLEVCGSVPIPPYLNRDTEEVDLERYQTLYARFRGSVAAPTAGLHFTNELMEALKAKGVDIIEISMITDEDITALSNALHKMGEDMGRGGLMRDADNIMSAEAVLLIGSREEAMCLNCGYVYEGDELPEDYECPLCGVGPDQFEEVEEEEKK